MKNKLRSALQARLRAVLCVNLLVILDHWFAYKRNRRLFVLKKLKVITLIAVSSTQLRKTDVCSCLNT